MIFEIYLMYIHRYIYRIMFILRYHELFISSSFSSFSFIPWKVEYHMSTSEGWKVTQGLTLQLWWKSTFYVQTFSFSTPTQRGNNSRPFDAIRSFFPYITCWLSWQQTYPSGLRKRERVREREKRGTRESTLLILSRRMPINKDFTVLWFVSLFR